MVCGFTEDGRFIFAGSNDCCIYVWHWDLGVTANARRQHRGGSNPYATQEEEEDELEGPSDAGARCALLDAETSLSQTAIFGQSAFPRSFRPKMQLLVGSQVNRSQHTTTLLLNHCTFMQVGGQSCAHA